MIEWFKSLFRPNAEKVVDAIQDDVLRAIVEYGKTVFDDPNDQLVYEREVIRLINIGGCSMAHAVSVAVNKARGDENEVETAR